MLNKADNQEEVKVVETDPVYLNADGGMQQQ